MTETSTIAIYGSMLVAGLAGSLHCVGMCGPILLGFSQLFARSGRRPLARDFFWYHAGRIWTYGVLGFGAGWAGAGLRHGAAGIAGQRPVSIALSLAVIATGLALLGARAGSRFDALLGGCGIGTVRASGFLQRLVAADGALPRLLLGAVLGLLPCGLVWAMLVAAAATRGPVEGAFGMLAFGVGTLPSLSAVLLAGRAIPARWRLRGPRVAAVTLILLGALMAARAIATPASHAHGAHAGSHAVSAEDVHGE